MNSRDRFHEAVDYFYKKNYHLAGQACRLGYPEMVSEYPKTAGVRWNSDKKKVEFMFNTKFCDSLDFLHFNFAVAHEAAHVFGGHIFMLKSEMDKLKNRGASQKEINLWVHRFNKAADCVVNDSLVNLYGMPRCEFPNDKGECTILYGKEVVGCDCHDLSVTDVMSLLPEEDSGQAGDVDNHELWKSFFNEDGSVNRDFVDSIKDFVEENIGNAALSDDDAEKIRKIQKAMEQCSDAYSREAGQSTSGSTRKVKASAAAVRWERLLFRKVEKNKFEDRWSKRNRKLEGVSDDIILPTSVSKETEEIFIAIDCSGSIDWEALELFVSVVKNTPKRFKINAITFNMSCQPFDIRKDEVRSGGGTSFSIIEQYIQDNFKKYPKAVFVLTDGGGNFVKPQWSNRWTWMLYGYSDEQYCKGMTTYKLENLLR